MNFFMRGAGQSEVVGPETDVFADSFTGTNGTSISGRVSDSGDVWTLRSSSLTIENNGMHNPLASGNGIATFDKGWSDVTAKLNCNLLQGGEEMGFVFRYADASNYWKVVIVSTGNGFRIVQVQGGVETIRKFLAQTNGYLEIRVSGDKVTAWCLGNVLEYVGINSMNPTSTIHGIFMKKSQTDVNNPTRGSMSSIVAWEGVSDAIPANEFNQITVSKPERFQIFQRTGSTGNITIEGSFIADGASHAIEASWNGGAYQTIATGRKQTFSGVLTNQPQGQGTLTVRLKDDTSKSFVVGGVGIGDIFVSAGQSNASGLISPNQSFSHATLWAANFGNSYKWMWLADPTDQPMGQVDNVSFSSPDAAGSYWPLLATSFMADQNVPFALIPCSAGGTKLSQWQKGANPEDRTTLFGSMVYRAKLQPNGIKAVFFHQGEGDVTTNDLTPPATYETLLNQFVNDVWDQLGVPVIITKIHKWDGAPTTTQADVDNLHGAIDNVIASNPHALLGADLDNPTRVTAGLHITTTAEATAARDRLWTRVKALFYT